MKQLFFVFVFLFSVTLFANDFSAYKLGGKIENPTKTGIDIVEYISSTKAITDSVYNTEGLPPVGDQGSQGSCTGWATGYYYMTYLIWEEKGWDTSVDSHICSPAFVYNQINGGEDGGSYTTDAYELFEKNGICMLSDMPYDDNDFTSWPSEEAYKNATYNRTLTSHASTFGTDFANLKQHLSDGHICTFSIYVWDNFYNISSANPFYSDSAKTGSNRGGHNVTIIGYNDSIVTPDGKGAFKCVNSWGTGWGDNGYWWITYQAMLNTDYVPYPYFYYADDRIDYEPQLWAGVVLQHSKNDQTRVIMGKGSTASPTETEEFFDFILDLYRDDWSYPDTVAYPTHPIIFDITELFDGVSDTFFVQFYDTLSDSVTGSIDSFFVYDNTGNFIASDDPIVSLSDVGNDFARIYFDVTGIAFTKTNRDSIIFDYRNKNMYSVSPVKLQKKEVLYPTRINLTDDNKGDTTWLFYDSGYTQNFYGINYFANVFYPEKACSLIGFTYGRTYNGVTDTVMVKLDNTGNPGTELYRTVIPLTSSGSGEIYQNILDPIGITGPFWIIFYAYTDNTDNYFGGDDDGGGNNSFYSADGSAWNSMAPYNTDLLIRAEVVYTDLYSDTAIVYVLNTDPSSERSFSIDSIYMKNNASWVVYLDKENNFVPLGDSTAITIGISLTGLDNDTEYRDTLVIETGADSLSKSVTIEVPVVLYTGENNFVDLPKEKESIENKGLSLFSIMPNPATDNVNIYLERTVSSANIKIVDINGRIIEEKNNVKDKFVWNRGDRKNGIYFIIVNTNLGRETKKLMLY